VLLLVVDLEEGRIGACMFISLAQKRRVVKVRYHLEVKYSFSLGLSSVKLQKILAVVFSFFIDKTPILLYSSKY
jgi:hypothetical protein